MPARQKEGTLSMPQTIEYEEKHFIIVNDIENSLFYFFDFRRPFYGKEHGI